MNKLKVLELFAGIGACSKALERLGIEHEIVDAVEIDKYAIKSFNAIHNTNFEPQDITTWDKDIDVDLIMHGSPCQDFSLAGLQAGGDKDSGTRSSLMYETIRIVEKLKPKYVIWENVKNLISKKHKHNFNAYIETMNELGYTSCYQVLNAKDYGIPQNRERVFTISIRKDLNEYFIFPQKQELKLRLKDMLEDEVDEKYYLSDKMIKYISADNNKWTGNNKESLINKSIASTINTGEGSRRCDASNYISNNVEDNYDLKNAYLRNFGSKGKLQDKEYCDTLTASMGTGGGNVPILKIKNNTKQGYLEAELGDGINISSRMKYQRGNVQKGMIQTLDSQGGNSKAVVINEKPQVLGGYGKIGSTNQYHLQNRIYNNQIGVTVTTTCNLNYIDNNLRIRKLTPKECWRLMGFDDKDFEKASQVNSNAQLYKQAGNSIVVNVLETIFKELL